MAGTEVAYLLRLLTHRLGLQSPAHRHKLRVLSSSASLPMDGVSPTTGKANRDESVEYLWDMFGLGGVHRAPSVAVAVPEAKREWQESVIGGKPEITFAPLGERLQAAPFVAFLESSASACSAQRRADRVPGA